MTFDISVIIEGYQLLVAGLGYTLLICGVAVPAGFIIGSLCALRSGADVRQSAVALDCDRLH